MINNIRFRLWRIFINKPIYLRFRLRVWIWYRLTDSEPSPVDWLRWQTR
jgi:hypothetical protein